MVFIVGRNYSIHYRTIASLQLGVEEARKLMIGNEAYYDNIIPDQRWCINHYEAFAKEFYFRD